MLPKYEPIFVENKIYNLTINDLLERRCNAIYIPIITIHDIRHSHASLLIEMGFGPLLIAERLGHEKVQTTLDTYGHLYPNKQIEVSRQLDELFQR